MAMIIQTEDDTSHYKDKLRKRFGSQIQLPNSPDNDNAEHDNLHVLNPSDPQSPGETFVPKLPFDKVTKTTQTDQEEPEVVEMSNFAEGSMDDKLNLLMAAINKVNTNFHM